MSSQSRNADKNKKVSSYSRSARQFQIQPHFAPLFTSLLYFCQKISVIACKKIPAEEKQHLFLSPKIHFFPRKFSLLLMTHDSFFYSCSDQFHDLLSFLSIQWWLRCSGLKLISVFIFVHILAILLKICQICNKNHS